MSSRIIRGRRRAVATTAALLAAGALVVAPLGQPAAAVGSWSPEETVGSYLDLYNYDREPAIVRVRANKTAVGAWVYGDDETAGPVTAATRGPAGAWSAPTAVSGDLTGNARYDLAVGPNGLASLVWERNVGGTWRVEESHLDGGSWTVPVELGVGRAPTTTVDGAGTTTVAWNNAGVRAVRRTATGSWGAVKSFNLGAGRDLRLASNAAGDVALTWIGPSWKVISVVRPHGKPWAAPRTLGQKKTLTSLQVAMAGNGRALVVWSVTDIWDAGAREYFNYVAWARSTALGQWSTTRVLTRRLGEVGGWVDLSMNGKGRAVAVWLQIYRSDSPAFAWVARFRTNGTWSAPGRVSKTPVAWEEPRAWMDRDDNAHVLAPRGDPRMIWHFSQRPGAGWKAAKLNRGDLYDAHGTGNRLVLLYYRAGLKARGLRVG